MAATSAISTPVIQILVAGALALLVWLIMDPVFLTGMSQGDVVGFITAAGLLAKPIRSLSEVNAVIQRGLAAATDIFGQFDEEAERDLGSFDGGRARGAVEFREVGFSYARSHDGKGAPVLQGISFRVEPGQTVALVGRSGSGKTTLVNLIPRFYENDDGTVLLDDRPVTEWQLAALRRQVALVSQSVVLFNDTVQRNIAYGGLAEASRDDVIEAARRAHALEFIERLPDGLDTIIGDDGVMLSGGQRQRLAIARKQARVRDATHAPDMLPERRHAGLLRPGQGDRHPVDDAALGQPYGRLRQHLKNERSGESGSRLREPFQARIG
jgi:subfamily B ATP-binding cassette protein MsbA